MTETMQKEEEYKLFSFPLSLLVKDQERNKLNTFRNKNSKKIVKIKPTRGEMRSVSCYSATLSCINNTYILAPHFMWFVALDRKLTERF